MVKSFKVEELFQGMTHSEFICFMSTVYFQHKSPVIQLYSKFTRLTKPALKSLTDHLFLYKSKPIENKVEVNVCVKMHFVCIYHYISKVLFEANNYNSHRV